MIPNVLQNASAKCLTLQTCLALTAMLRDSSRHVADLNLIGDLVRKQRPSIHGLMSLSIPVWLFIISFDPTMSQSEHVV